MLRLIQRGMGLKWWRQLWAKSSLRYAWHSRNKGRGAEVTAGWWRWRGALGHVLWGRDLAQGLLVLAGHHRVYCAMTSLIEPACLSRMNAGRG